MPFCFFSFSPRNGCRMSVMPAYPIQYVFAFGIHVVSQVRCIDTRVCGEFFLIKRLYGFESGASTHAEFLVVSQLAEMFRSKRRGGAFFPFFLSTSVTVRGYCATSFRISSPASCVAKRFQSGRKCGVSVDCLEFPRLWVQNFRFPAGGSQTNCVSVGVQTAPPTEPGGLLYLIVYNRVAFMPRIQSPMALHNPAVYRGSSSSWLLRFANPLPDGLHL